MKIDKILSLCNNPKVLKWSTQKSNACYRCSECFHNFCFHNKGFQQSNQFIGFRQRIPARHVYYGFSDLRYVTFGKQKENLKILCSKIYLCLFTFMWLLRIDGKAQDSLKRVSMPLYIHGSFFYDFPQSFGAAAGVHFPLRSKVIFTKNKAGKEKAKYRDLIIASDIGFYRYPFNNTGIYLFQSIGKRYHKEKPYYFEWLASIGVMRTFYDGIVYSVDNNGNVKILNGFGRYYATTGFAAVFGHNFERSNHPKPFAIDIKPSLWIQYPYNSFILPHFSVWLTFKYHFNRFNISAKQKQVRNQ